ncbi:hypothetical protein GQ53DRAFT_844304 [Thozetella sp. PMI_491]|nr:hypothetical protein GQ53DRAFT_844304 [Thozetella sp. PMI_491]
MSSSSPLSSEETLRDSLARTEAAAAPVDYKAMLDEAAEKDKMKDTPKPPQDSSGASPIVETVSRYVQTLGKILGQTEPEKAAVPTASGPAPGPPHRPDHDPQIEEFVRDQHRSSPVRVATSE